MSKVKTAFCDDVNEVKERWSKREKEKERKKDKYTPIISI